MLKAIIPKSLFARFILIIMVPTIMAQIIATYIFYNRHWSNVSFHMIDSLVGEVYTIVKLRESNYPEQMVKLLESDLRLNIKFIRTFKSDFKEEDPPEALQMLHSTLKLKINHKINLSYIHDENDIEIDILMPRGILSVAFSRKRVENPTTYIFIMWMTGTSAVFFILSLIFSKNQIRPIIRLARVAEQFGKGISIGTFKPEGALEVRKASIAFLKMKERIERQISQRTEILTGVSHDLRTPLTRMKLELAMCKDKIAKEIEEDVIEMEKMIKSYLDFARGEGTEKSTLTSIDDLITTSIGNYRKQGKDIKYRKGKKVQIMLKHHAMQRVFSNLLDNAFTYASKVKITYLVDNEYLTINIEDNGPGIADEERENVFRPFYRIDISRNNETGGVGLGLSIVRDIVSSHGGEVVLSESENMGGLKIIIKLPR